MLRIALLAGGDCSYFSDDFDYYVGVDRGSLTLLEHQLPLDLAVGDFDSVTSEELTQIKMIAKKVITAPAEKDDTDTELALKYLFQSFTDCQVTIFGALGGRLDHTLANIFLPSDPELTPFMESIYLRDAQNLVQYFPEGRHTVSKIEGMDYVSFMTDQEADLEIRGAKYNLTARHFFKKKIYGSNEFIGQPITFSVSAGYVVVIQTKDKE